MTLSWQRAATGAPAGRSQRCLLGSFDASPAGGRGVRPGAELVIILLSLLEDVRTVQWAPGEGEALDRTVTQSQEVRGAGYYLCARFIFSCKSTGRGGLGVVSVGQVEPGQVWPETRPGPFPFCWGLLSPTVGGTGSAVSSRGG